jgi:SAM-dependent methyltransferase
VPVLSFEDFACPSSGRSLRLQGQGLVSDAGAQFPIVNGIPRFVESEHYARSFGLEWLQFPRTQLDSANGTRISETRFRQLFPFELSSLKGKRVLDAGCGMGRFVEVVANQGAEVVGMDLSQAVDAARANTLGRANVTIAQADVMAPPFADSVFDFIYSFGVVHHTPAPAQAVRELARRLKPGGFLTVWVYGRRASTRIPRPHQIYGNLLRPLPEPQKALVLRRYAQAALRLSRLPGSLGKVAELCFPIQNLEKRGKGQDGFEPGPRKLSPALVEEWAWLSAVDGLTPRYTAQFVFSEVEAWFRDAGLINLKRGATRVCVTGQRPFSEPEAR